MREFDLSPSLYHKHIMKGIKSELAFDGENVVEWQKKVASKVK